MVLEYVIMVEETKMQKKAFTLVELLIVMAIIGVLASIGIGSFMTAQMRGRDAQRKSDLKQISHALELYYSDHKKYPDPLPTWGSEFKDVNGTVYFKELPSDPVANQSYTYTLVNGSNQKYRLSANLENTQDKLYPILYVTSANTNATE